MEIWSLSAEAFGHFVAALPEPMGIGKVTLADGSMHPGFLCEAYALEGAEDITALWRLAGIPRGGDEVKSGARGSHRARSAFRFILGLEPEFAEQKLDQRLVFVIAPIRREMLRDELVGLRF